MPSPVDIVKQLRADFEAFSSAHHATLVALEDAVNAVTPHIEEVVPPEIRSIVDAIISLQRPPTPVPQMTTSQPTGQITSSTDTPPAQPSAWDRFLGHKDPSET